MNQYVAPLFQDGPAGNTPLTAAVENAMAQGVQNEDVTNVASPAHAFLFWTPSTVYAAGQQVISPSGDVISRTGAGTSASTYAADAANWNLSTTFVTAGAVRRNLNGQAPTLSKLASNPIFTLGAQGSTFSSIQWPWLVNVVQQTGTTGQFGETYRIYYSTDHEAATARIGLLTATSITGAWTDRGQVYQDTNGNQTETPAAIWNPVENLWFMYYHEVSVPGTTTGEVTLLATSPNGVDTWTRVGPVADYPSGDSGGYPPGGGLGYFRPFRIGNKWFALSLLAGGDYARFALWLSNDGRSWALDPRPLGNGSDLTGTGFRVEWNSGTVFYWNGEMWWCGLISNFTSGGAARVTNYGLSRISSDFRTLLSPPVFPFASLQAWETSPSDNRSGGSLIADADGRLVLAYSGGTQGFGLAIGV